jgi:RNA polymerase sigma factor (sigma-70 family)
MGNSEESAGSVGSVGSRNAEVRTQARGPGPGPGARGPSEERARLCESRVETLLQNHRGLLLAHASRFLGPSDEDGAEGVVQAAAMEALRKPDILSGHPFLDLPTMRSVVANFARNRRRAEDLRRSPLRRKDHQVGASRLDPWDEAARMQRNAQIAAALQELPEEARRVVEFRFYDGLAYDEIAARMGCSTRTIHRRWAAAAQILASALDELRPGP